MMTYKCEYNYYEFCAERNELLSRIKIFRKPVPKEDKLKIIISKFVLMFSIIGLICLFSILLGIEKFDRTGIIIICSIGAGLATLGAVLQLSEYDKNLTRCYDKRNKIFGKEIAELEEYEQEQHKQAREWREAHPLEELCRKALSGNPNYVADLIREICPDILVDNK